LSPSELQPAYRQVFEYLGLRDLRDDATHRAKLGGEESNSGTGVERFFSYFLPQPNFVVRFASTLRSPNVAIYTYATVIGIDFDGGTAVSVAAISPNGRQYRFDAKTVVVAGGTIGSNRLMLSLQRCSAVPWKDNANVGAYFHVVVLPDLRSPTQSDSETISRPASLAGSDCNEASPQCRGPA